MLLEKECKIVSISGKKKMWQNFTRLSVLCASHLPVEADLKTNPIYLNWSQWEFPMGKHCCKIKALSEKPQNKNFI